MKKSTSIMDGNEAAATIAYKTNEVIAIYPITPASPMGELSDQWSSQGLKNIWGTVPKIIEMQSEGGAAGAVHGSLQGGALTTTFTASQGLLLMLPNMYKIAGELSPAVIHIAARSIAAQGLSIFGDHTDVMAARSTGFGFLFSNSVQEAMDMALVAQMSTLKSRIPFLHIFDGFRTSHELQKVELIEDDQIRSLIDSKWILDIRKRSMNPEKPFIRGTAQNPDAYFQARESVNSYYLATPDLVQQSMDELAQVTGRQYKLYEYVGSPNAKEVIVIMGSGAETVEETVSYLNNRSEEVGVLKVRLFRPFSSELLINALPDSVESIAVMDRTKEPGSNGDPLYLDISNTIRENSYNQKRKFNHVIKIIGGRYGLSSKEFTPAMVKSIFDELRKENSKNHFTIGITDDVTHTSLEFDQNFTIEPESVKRAIFWGLGSDGTVGANKNSIKIIGDETNLHTQGYFVYDSKKAGARTISHLRFGTEPIKSTYLIQKANFIAVHQFGFLDRFHTLETAEFGATLLINAPFEVDEVWDNLPADVQKIIIDKSLDLYVIDAFKVARENGLGIRINTIMQTCFFAISKVIEKDIAIAAIKKAISSSYGKRGKPIVDMNNNAVDQTLNHLYKVNVPDTVTSKRTMSLIVPDRAPEFVQHVTAQMIAGNGDQLPVSAFPVDGTYESATTKWEKRNIAQEIPVWDPSICIQCGKCVIACPHSVIRAKVYEPEFLEKASDSFKFAEAKWRDFNDMKYTIQVAPEDCTGCTLCVVVCPAKDKTQVGRKALNMEDQALHKDEEKINWEYFFNELPESKPLTHPELNFTKVKDVQLLDPTFEFSSACAGCGETPYLRLLSSLYGDRAYIANATGCSSIYGGNLPTTPWGKDRSGRGPAWNNSLFEDNAEFGVGIRLAYEKQREYAFELLKSLKSELDATLVDQILQNEQVGYEGIEKQRTLIDKLKESIEENDNPKLRYLFAIADQMINKDVWIIGGDGWAYDIGFGGLDHVLASGLNVNILVLDTEVYSNTGGQASKATSLGAVAKFAAGGKTVAKKDLVSMAMGYGNVYVAQIALGADENHTIKALQEAQSYSGTSLIVAYSHCIAHGYDMADGFKQQDLAAKTGYWPLLRYDPRRVSENLNPLQLDSKKPKITLDNYIYNENRYSILKRAKPEVAETLFKEAQHWVDRRWQKLESMAKQTENKSGE